MATSRRRRPGALLTLLACLFVLMLGGLSGAYGMLMDPSGAGMGLPPGLLDKTPVRDYTLPGLFLLVVYGLAPLAAIYGLWTLAEWRWLQKISPWRGMHWAWSLTVALGIVLILWIALEFLLWGYIFFLQPTLGALGVLMLGLCCVPDVRAYAQVGAGSSAG